MKIRFQRSTTAGLPGALSVLLALVPAAHAALRDWDGDASMDNKWSTEDNWGGNVAPNPGDDLLFRSGERHPNNNNDFKPGTTFNSIELRGGGSGGGGSGYNIGGNSIALNAGLRVENNTGVPIDHTVNNSLLLNSNQIFFVHNPVGILFLPGTINLNGRDLTVDVTLGSQAQFQGVIGGAGGLLKTGDGTLMLTANNTCTGATTLQGGTLHINGSQPACPVVLMAGTLKGVGTVGTLTAFGNGGPGSILLSPGGSPGILTCSHVALNASTTFVVELNGTTAGSGHDQLRVNGSVSLGNAALWLAPGFTPAVGSSFIIINNDGADAVLGTFSGLPGGSILVHPQFTDEFRISYAGGDGNDVVLTRVPSGTASAPRLTIERAASDAVRLLWPTNPPGFNLECNTHVTGANWLIATPPPSLVGTNHVVTNAAAEARKFYRLRKN